MIVDKEYEYNCCIKFTIEQKNELNNLAKEYGLTVTQLVKATALNKLKQYKGTPSLFN